MKAGCYDLLRSSSCFFHEISKKVSQKSGQYQNIKADQEKTVMSEDCKKITVQKNTHIQLEQASRNEPNLLPLVGF